MESGMPIAAEPPVAPAAPQSLTLGWAGDMRDIARLCLINAALTVLTLGIYVFWGKTEIRKRLWFSVRINGEPVEYRCEGHELFMGFLIIAALAAVNFLFLLVVSLNIDATNATAIVLYQYTLYALAFFWVSAGFYRARSYRLSRTHWRGIGAGLAGSSWRFGWTSLWTLYLIPTICVGLLWLAFEVQGMPFPASSIGWNVAVIAIALASLAQLPLAKAIGYAAAARLAALGELPAAIGTATLAQIRDLVDRKDLPVAALAAIEVAAAPTGPPDMDQVERLLQATTEAVAACFRPPV